MKVYLSVPIVANRNARRARLMARAIADSGHEVSSPWVLLPAGEEGPPSPDVFTRDKRGVEASDAILADVSAPSTGVGMEVMEAHMLGKRVMLAVAKGSTVSKMVMQLEPAEKLEFAGDQELYDAIVKALSAPRPSGLP